MQALPLSLLLPLSRLLTQLSPSVPTPVLRSVLSCRIRSNMSGFEASIEGPRSAFASSENSARPSRSILRPNGICTSVNRWHTMQLIERSSRGSGASTRMKLRVGKGKGSVESSGAVVPLLFFVRPSPLSFLLYSIVVYPDLFHRLFAVPSLGPGPFRFYYFGRCKLGNK